jgi:hypothetical protein
MSKIAIFSMSSTKRYDTKIIMNCLEVVKKSKCWFCHFVLEVVILLFIFQKEFEFFNEQH